MNGGANGGYIDEAMEQLPFPAETPDPSLCRRDGQRDHQHEGREAHRDERAFHDVFDDEGPGEKLIDRDIEKEVGAHVEECEEAEHPSVLDNAIPAGQPPQWRDGESQHEETERPDAGGQFQVFNGIDPEAPGQRSRHEPRERRET